MKLFHCPTCRNIVYFENRSCAHCGHLLAFRSDTSAMANIVTVDGSRDVQLTSGSAGWRLCANAAYDACNWLVTPESEGNFCLACRHNAVIPALDVEANIVAWRKVELAKHRLFYTLLRWHLPLKTPAEDGAHGLSFHFLADPASQSGARVMTGHENGKVTLALIEADDAERERRRQAMNEPYRTLLGHFRHEIGHHYWDLLVRDGGKLEAFRNLFGDDTRDYGQALRSYYENGPPEDWQEKFVSQYSASHPWEDFAETWAHYLHIVDTLEMAFASGLSVHPQLDRSGAHSAEVTFDPYTEGTIGRVIEAWLPVVFAINNMNRAMGHSDAYPFILAPSVIAKLGFIHDLVHGVTRTSASL
jgi:hypothetical protein